jgi:Ser/Thr protein kinase RdoA (MazF antagonist)
VVAQHLTELLDDSRTLRLGLPDGLSAYEHSRLRELLPRIRSQFAALADSDVPATLEHNDFHDGNVCLRSSDYRVFDWGDACVAHPFVALRVGLRSIAHTLDLAADGPEITRLRDAYLEPWTAFAPRTQLLADVQPALILAAACRALAWRLVVRELDPPLLGEWADTVAYSVRSMLELAEAAA